MNDTLLGCRYTLKVVKNGKVTKTIETKNLITDWGLDIINGYSIYTAFVGTGVHSTDTTVATLTNQLPTSASTSSTTYNTAVSPTYMKSATLSFVFPVGAFNNDVITEVGVTTYYGSPNMFSRAEVVPSITVAPDEELHIAYTLEMYPPLTDVTTSLANTATGESYSLVTRAIASDWNASTDFSYRGSTRVFGDGFILGSLSGYVNQTILAYTGTTKYAYVQGSHERLYSITISTAEVTVPIGGLRFYLGGTVFETKITPSIPKTSTTSFSLTFKVSWGRKL